MTLREHPFTADELDGYPPGYGAGWYASGMDGGEFNDRGDLFRWYTRVKSPDGSTLEGRGHNHDEARRDLIAKCHAHATTRAAVQACSDRARAAAVDTGPTADDATQWLATFLADCRAAVSPEQYRKFLDANTHTIQAALWTAEDEETDAARTAAMEAARASRGIL